MTTAMDAKDKLVLQTIEGFVDLYEKMPTYREIAELADISSTAVVSGSLRRLDRAGYIRLPPKGQKRSLALLRSSQELVAVETGRKRSAADLLADAAELLDPDDDGIDRVTWHRRDAWLRDYRRWKK